MHPRLRKSRSWNRDAMLLLAIVFVFHLVGCVDRRAAKSPTINSSKNQPREASNAPKDVLARKEKMVAPVNANAENKSVQSSSGTDKPREPNTKSLRLFLGDYRNRPDEQLELTDEQLHKNFTLMLLAHQPDIRAREVIKYARNILTDEQKEVALEMALAEDHRFQKLKRKRAEILEHAFDGFSVKEDLRKIDVETVMTSRLIRSKVHTQVLTQEQREQLVAQRKQPTVQEVAEPSLEKTDGEREQRPGKNSDK